MRTVILFCSFIICVSCAKPGLQSPASTNISFYELRYGICTTEPIDEQRMRESPSGHLLINDQFRLLKTTDHIPAFLQQEFGVEYMLQGNLSGIVIVEQVWILPAAIRDEKGKRFKEVRYVTEKPLNEKSFSVYTIEKPYELVKGEWIYQMWYGKQKLYERKFYLE